MKATQSQLQAFEARTAAQQQAARLYPHSPQLQAEWLRAIGVVRSTSRGWLLDTVVHKGASNAQ